MYRLIALPEELPALVEKGVENVSAVVAHITEGPHTLMYFSMQFVVLCWSCTRCYALFFIYVKPATRRLQKWRAARGRPSALQ
jgi:hypothetical protein